jgi:hypothetical protein
MYGIQILTFVLYLFLFTALLLPGLELLRRGWDNAVHGDGSLFGLIILGVFLLGLGVIADTSLHRHLILHPMFKEIRCSSSN